MENSDMSTPSAGIAAIGLSFPSLAMPVEELAALRGQDPKKFTLGLGCREMALCGRDEGVVDLAAEAARRSPSAYGRPTARARIPSGFRPLRPECRVRY